MNDLTLAEALARFRTANGLRADETEADTWTCRIGPITLRLPNFAWRRRAILAHDVHHLLTGYPCSMRGEFQMAVWELAAGRMPHWAATHFCLPLVAIGVAWSPQRMWHAYRAGRQSQSLHNVAAVERLLGQKMSDVRVRSRSSRRKRSAGMDAARFAMLVAGAAAVMFGPIAGLIAVGVWLAA